MKNLILFASGGGSNALKIIQYFENHQSIKVASIVTNNKHAGVIDIANKYNIPHLVLSKKQLNDKSYFMPILLNLKADYIILAGFLLLIPEYLVHTFPHHILNIHPALLPKYGGKGMHGMYVHKAVVDAKESFSGPTIHLVNKEYDKGEILFQITTEIDPYDDPEDVAKKVLSLEHKYYAPIIEKYILAQKEND